MPRFWCRCGAVSLMFQYCLLLVACCFLLLLAASCFSLSSLLPLVAASFKALFCVVYFQFPKMFKQLVSAPTGSYSKIDMAVRWGLTRRINLRCYDGDLKTRGPHTDCSISSQQGPSGGPGCQSMLRPTVSDKHKLRPTASHVENRDNDDTYVGTLNDLLQLSVTATGARLRPIAGMILEHTLGSKPKNFIRFKTSSRRF